MDGWSAKDKAAEEATELASANLGASANAQEFATEDYLGPSWNIFTSWWNWMRRKLGHSH